jgi:hypothetical protein
MVKTQHSTDHPEKVENEKIPTFPTKISDRKKQLPTTIN